MNWQESVASKSIDKIKFALLEMWQVSGKIDLKLVNPMELVTVNNFRGQEQTVSIIEVLLNANNLSQDAQFFDIAKELLREGAAMPKQHRNQEIFSSTSAYLKHLADDEHDLFIALYTDPHIINLQGEDGKTMLHHAASLGVTSGSNSASLILGQLFQSPLADFRIQDAEGNTPLHVAAYYCRDRVTRNFIFPCFAREAAKRQFDFSILNHQGQSVRNSVENNSYQSGIKILDDLEYRNNQPQKKSKFPFFGGSTGGKKEDTGGESHKNHSGYGF